MLTVEKRATQPPVQDLANVCIIHGNESKWIVGQRTDAYQ